MRPFLSGLVMLAACGAPADSAGEACVDEVERFRDLDFELAMTPTEDSPSKLTASWDGDEIVVRFTDELGRTVVLSAIPE